MIKVTLPINGITSIVSKNRRTSSNSMERQKRSSFPSPQDPTEKIRRFRFEGFNTLNREDQTELKKKFGTKSAATKSVLAYSFDNRSQGKCFSRKRKGGKTEETTDDQTDSPKAKLSKVDENVSTSSEDDETRLRKVRSSRQSSIRSFLLLQGTKRTLVEIQRCAEKGSSQRRSERIARTQ